jgi:hypothetical protein
MSAKASLSLALVVTALGLGPARAAEPSPMPIEGSIFAVEAQLPAPTSVIPAPAAPPTPTPPSAELLPPPSDQPPMGGIAAASGLSNWIRNTRPDCCNPIGRHGPIETELYMYNGPAIPIGGGIFNRLLDTGWDVQFGGRSLFFNAEMNGAWTADAGLGYNYNHGKPSRTVGLLPRGSSPTRVPTQTHIRALHRTAVSTGLGREWYLYVWPGDSGAHVRAGFDAGGRMGSVRADLVELPHRTDVMYAVYTALHTDLEIPRGCCTFQMGFRIEWDHQWMSIWQSQNNSNLQDANVLLNLGIRY